ncbi:lysophospholipid acyltransferase family protein [Cellulomonas chengniuliangii]|uniref:lysophospholipid acyltransferase family protein n=1 Tax=Cellulomonas chengniuliangii TaxID=2968084 RepID=UPI001D0F1DF4|nr:lysophospholipid acyltransferase family protein [Cellulomonas chengniuliangii]MCC2317291.1 1-acyl-sn-glycerol-3-phosphate acyltransferase [Cellulomonas chengniuliangii]
MTAEGTAQAAPPREAAPVPDERQARRGHTLGKFFAHVLWNTEVIGAENVPADGPVLLAANHSGFADGPVLVGASPRPSHVLIKASMFAGVVGSVLRNIGQIPVEEDGGRGSLAMALGVLRRGGVVGVFPEGSRGRGDVADARAGVAWLAINGGARVVPVAVLGTRRTGEPVGRMPGLRRRLVVEFGEPLSLERAPGTSGRAAVAHANEEIRVALAALVGSAAERAGLPLPTDDPNREAQAAH